MDVKILVVDDEQSIRDWMSNILSGYGYFIDTAEDYYSAVKMITLNQYDVVFIDKNMPDSGEESKSGIRLLKYVKENAPETEVIIMTGFATVETAVDAMKSGAFDYITKPFRIEDLNEKITRILEYRAFIDSRLNLQIYKNLYAELLGLLQNENNKSEEDLNQLLKNLGRRIDHLFGTQKNYEAVIQVQKTALENIKVYTEKMEETIPTTHPAYELIDRILKETAKQFT